MGRCYTKESCPSLLARLNAGCLPTNHPRRNPIKSEPAENPNERKNSHHGKSDHQVDVEGVEGDQISTDQGKEKNKGT